MKKHLVLLAGSLLLATTVAMAGPSPQNNDHHDGHNPHGQNDRHDDRGHENHGHDNRGHDDRGRGDRYDHGHDRYYGGRHDDRGHGYYGPHYGPSRGYYVVHDRGPRGGWYRRGGYVPMQYRESRYYVSDWRSERLREPPRGYRWIRGDDGQFLLVAIASGVIADILLSH